MPDIESIFTELFKTYYGSLINYCISMKIQLQDAEDIVSETFARAYSKAEQFIPLNEKQQKAWLYSAASMIIKEKRAKKVPISFSELDCIENYIQDKGGIDKFHANEDFDMYLKEIYANLTSDKDRELFELIFDKKVDYKTIIEKYGVSAENSRVMVSRLRSKIRNIVNKMLTK